MMKYKLIPFFLFLFASQVFAADNFGYIVGGITPHYQKPDGVSRKFFCNELAKDSGIIYNELNSFRYQDGNQAFGFIVGENSYCSPIYGASYSHKIYNSERINSNLTLGFYHFKQEGFDFSEGAYFGRVGNFYFVPIVGAEINIVAYRSREFEIQFMNLITPVLTNHSVGIFLNF